MTPEAALTDYLKEAVSWDTDRTRQARRTTQLALWTAGLGWVAVLALALAILILVPLKHVEPFVVRVDNATGIVDVVPVYAGNSAIPESVTRYLLTHYITVCERFNFSTAESDYEECGAFHTAQRNQAWYALWNPNNPASPLNANKDGSSIRAEVISVSFFKRANGLADLAQVRYFKAKRAGGSSEETVTHWIATLQYAYADPSMDPKVRRWNPLGFKIVDFKPEPEILPEAPVSTPGKPTHAMASAGGAP